MKLISILSVIVFFFAFHNLASSQYNDKDKILILIDEGEKKTVDEVLKEFDQNGGKILHLYHPHIYIGYLSVGRENILNKWGSKVQFYRQEIDPQIANKYGNIFKYAIEGWNNNFYGQAKSKGLDPSRSEYIPTLPNNDALSVDPKMLHTNQSLVLNKPQGAGYYDVSEFLYGKITINVILPESDGSIDPQTENWTSQREQNVVSEIQQGLTWLASQESRANLSFVYHFYFGRTDNRAKTWYEPISRSSNDQGLWINQVFGNFGYTTGSYFDRTFAFQNDWISNDNSDWGILIWVVDSYVDQDGKFTNGDFAYAFLGGPFLVMTYDNDGWGIGKMDAVVSHEVEHNFHTLDEYQVSQELCTTYSGYLNIQNKNAELGGCNVNLPCIMKSGDNVNGICTYTRQMLGWKDSDGDNILDIADTYPSTTLLPVIPNPTYDKTPTLTGFGTEVPIPNQNPYPGGHIGTRNNISPNRINQLWGRVDGGSWQIIYGSNWDFVLAPLDDGSHSFELQARNSVGNFDITSEIQNFVTLGHLHSSLPSVLSSNNGKKIARDSDGGYHVVYADEDLIYYTFSYDDGANWSTEEILSNYTFGSNTHPSIAIHQNYLFVVWQEYQGMIDGMHQYEIKGVWKEPGNPWKEIIGTHLISRFENETDPLPIIIAADNTVDEIEPSNPPSPELLTAWMSNDGVYSAIGHWDVMGGYEKGNGKTPVYRWNSNYQFGKVPSTNEKSINPSISTDLFSKVGLAYEEDRRIYAHFNNGSGWSEQERVSEEVFGDESHLKPSITIDRHSRLIVAWEYWDGETLGSSINVRRQENVGEWGVTTRFQGERKDPHIETFNNYSPSVTSYPTFNDDIAVTWYTNENTVQIKKYQYNEWDKALIVADPGYNPNLSQNTSQSLNAKIIYRDNREAPYSLTFTSHLLPEKNDFSQEIYREVRVTGDSFAIKLFVGEIALQSRNNSKRILFSSFPDTTIIRGLGQIKKVFKTVPFFVEQNSDIIFWVNIKVYNPEWINDNWSSFTKVKLNIDAIDSATGLNIGKIFSVEISKNKIPSVKRKIRLNVNSLFDRKIYLIASVNISRDLVVMPSITEEQSASSLNDHMNVPVFLKQKQEVPSNFFLEKNYPNPFNPTTTIRYQLPTDVFVTLKVYDIVGREVVTLVNSFQTAGYKLVEFNATNLQSGIYFYRIMAGNFISTRKLVLMK